MNFLKIGKLFKSKTTIILVFSIISFFLFSDVSFAEGEATKGINQTIDLLQGVVKLLASLLGIMTSFVSMFLHPSWVNGSIFGLDSQFKTIWILISNVVYFIFALILVAIAFMNIIGQGTDHYEIKQALPKLVVGVLIVPISWFFVQFILSISAILTVSVLSLPFDTFKNEAFFTDMTKTNTGSICTNYVINLGGSGSKVDGYSLNPEEGKIKDGSGFLYCKDELTSIDTYVNGDGGGVVGLKDSVFGIITIYTYGVMELNNLDKVTADMKGISTIADLLVNKVIFDLIFFVIYFLLMVALFLALFTRGVWIWIYTMFSPVFGLIYFLGKSKEGFGEEGSKFGILGFIKLAMVPVLVGAALSFGLVFLFVIGHSLNSSTKHPVFCDQGEVNCIKFAGIKLTIKGVNETTETKSATGDLGIGGFLGNTIMKIMGLVVLWMSIMAALRSSDITNAVAKPIMEFGESVGSLAKGGLKYLPIMPAPGGGAMSAETIKGISTGLGNAVSSYSNNKMDSVNRKLFGNSDKFDVNANLGQIQSYTPKTINDKMIEAIPLAKGDSNNFVDSENLKKIFSSNEIKNGLDKKYYDDKGNFKLDLDTKEGTAKALAILNNYLLTKGQNNAFLSSSRIDNPDNYTYGQLDNVLKSKQADATATANTIQSSKDGNNTTTPPANSKQIGNTGANYTTNENNVTINNNDGEKLIDITNEGKINGNGIDTFSTMLNGLGGDDKINEFLEEMIPTNFGNRKNVIRNIITNVKKNRKNQPTQ